MFRVVLNDWRGIDGVGRCLACVVNDSERRNEGSRGYLGVFPVVFAMCEWYSSSDRSRSPSSSNQRKLS